MSSVDDNDDGSTNSTDKSRASNFSYIANDKTTNHSNAQNNDDKNDDHHIEQNMTTGLDQDQVCVSLFSAPINIPYHSFHNAFDTICQPVLLFCHSAVLPFCFSAVLLFCCSACTSRRLQMYYI